ncbi:MAG: carbohydrate ABC transporter permease [bacterium]|nr:carbohydrate ABC transporter permease [Candidatus Sumerlaeota bacterium]
MKQHFRSVVAHACLSSGALLMLIPLAWMILTSLKTFTEVYREPPVWLPQKPMWSNYVEALTSFDFALYLRNSLVVVILAITGTFLSSAMAAYAFARLRAKGKEAFFILLLSTMMLPAQVTVIPVFRMYVSFGWINTLYPMFVPAWLGVNVFAIFLLRQFFASIPQDYVDSARIDGASEWAIIFRVFVALSKPAILTVIVFTFMGSWNDLWTPLLFVHDQQLYTLPLALFCFLSKTIGVRGVQWELMMAASAIVIIPLIVVFFFSQRYFVEGITMTGLKA